MKKLFFIAFLAVGVSALAQHVTPIDFEIADVKIDSLRTLYISEPTMYRAALEVVAQNLAKNANAQRMQGLEGGKHLISGGHLLQHLKTFVKQSLAFAVVAQGLVCQTA